MNEVSIVGVDLAKRVFQLHGSRADGTVVFRKKVTRGQVLTVLIPRFNDQNSFAQSRNPMDMIFQGCSTSLFQA